MGVYCLDSQSNIQLTSQRKLLCFERVSGMCTVWKKPVVVCGTKAGALALYDLRQLGTEITPSFSSDVQDVL